MQALVVRAHALEHGDAAFCIELCNPARLLKQLGKPRLDVIQAGGMMAMISRHVPSATSMRASSLARPSRQSAMGSSTSRMLAASSAVALATPRTYATDVASSWASKAETEDDPPMQ